MCLIPSKAVMKSLCFSSETNISVGAKTVRKYFQEWGGCVCLVLVWCFVVWVFLKQIHRLYSKSDHLGTRQLLGISPPPAHFQAPPHLKTTRESIFPSQHLAKHGTAKSLPKFKIQKATTYRSILQYRTQDIMAYILNRAHQLARIPTGNTSQFPKPQPRTFLTWGLLP